MGRNQRIPAAVEKEKALHVAERLARISERHLQSLPRMAFEDPKGRSQALDPEVDALFGEFYRRATGNPDETRLTLRAWLDLAETWRILEALRQCRGNRSAAARALGIGRRTLYTKMDKLGIQPSWETREPSGSPPIG